MARRRRVSERARGQHVTTAEYNEKEEIRSTFCWLAVCESLSFFALTR